MKKFDIGVVDAGKRIDKWLLKTLPALPMGLMQKYVRLKRIKLNGKPAKADARLETGDVVELYINDEYFVIPERTDALLNTFRWRLSIVYEDDQILIADKPVGLIVHPDTEEKINTLVTHVRAYLYQKGEYDSLAEGSFSPVPCNRIDRFTGGLVIIAKTREAMTVINRAIRDHEIEKVYLAIVHGCPRPSRGLIDNWILKTPGRRKVRVLHHEEPGAQRTQTRYEVLASTDELSLVECTLITGRTHQIRAQFAHLDHPLLGDGQYGDPMEAQRLGLGQQALCAYKLRFRFKKNAGVLQSLSGKVFELPYVDFVDAYFPGFGEE